MDKITSLFNIYHMGNGDLNLILEAVSCNSTPGLNGLAYATVTHGQLEYVMYPS
jgi:hypothetical protein